MVALLLKTEPTYNPLDLAEMVIMDREWVFDRPEDGAIIAEVSGVWCNYSIWLNWQEDTGGLTLSCALDSKFPKHMLMKLHSLLALVNNKLWLGHFDANTEENTVVFRYSMMLREGISTSSEHLQELMDLAISECERFYPAFQSVVWGGKSAAEALEIAIFDTIAEC